ncbi:hypothetical protein BZG36_03521 [Bifiguratus adelaidae]|uniref:non-specific serine/threonine protein kinase n=1 Tax=Bifiguratus adelaidae TaxID=1938954 RepID=A0A261XY52_9FUNG|nr:hypothetical protein BZG36_03521 [Bifiguratus adelaidae]
MSFFRLDEELDDDFGHAGEEGLGHYEDDGFELSQLNSETINVPGRPQDDEYEVPIQENYVSSYADASEVVAGKVGLEDFEMLRVLGRGAFGKVILVRHIKTSHLYAMKVLQKASLIVKAKRTEHTKAERQILEDVQHPFIVKLYYAFQTSTRLYLILQYVQGGELFTHMAVERMFSEEVAAFYAAQLILALEHLHSLGIVYRDLKPENCLVDHEGNVVLTDFGLCKVAIADQDRPDTETSASNPESFVIRTATVCGTIEFMAPEILLEQPYDQSVDWWSLGVVIYDMLTGDTPFMAHGRKKTQDAILQKKLKLPYYLSPDAKDLLTRLLRKNPSVRLGSGKNGADAVKKHRFFRRIDWDKLQRRELVPPIIPVITRPELAENFDAKYASMSLTETPNTSHVQPSLGSSYNHVFQGFSFVAPDLMPKGDFQSFNL